MEICLYVSDDIDIDIYNQLTCINKIIHYVFFDKDYIEFKLQNSGFEKNEDIEEKLLYYVNVETNQELYFARHFDILQCLLKKVNYIYVGNKDLPIGYLKYIRGPTFTLICNMKYYYLYENNFNVLNRKCLLFHIHNDNYTSEKCKEFILLNEGKIFRFPDSYTLISTMNQLKHIYEYD